MTLNVRPFGSTVEDHSLEETGSILINTVPDGQIFLPMLFHISRFPIRVTELVVNWVHMSADAKIGTKQIAKKRDLEIGDRILYIIYIYKQVK